MSWDPPWEDWDGEFEYDTDHDPSWEEPFSVGELLVVTTTDLAILVTPPDEPNHPEPVWIPKSCVLSGPQVKGAVGEITVRLWWAKKRGVT